MVWIPVLSVLIWVQTVYKDYEQTKKVSAQTFFNFESQADLQEITHGPCMLGNFAYCFCAVSADFFKNKLFQNLLEIPSACQKVWVQTLCKGYQQMTKLAEIE